MRIIYSVEKGSEREAAGRAMFRVRERGGGGGLINRNNIYILFKLSFFGGYNIRHCFTYNIKCFITVLMFYL